MKIGDCDVLKVYVGSCEIKKIYVGDCLIYDATGVVQALWGITPDPADDRMLDVRIGTGGLTEDRVANIWLPDWQDVYQEFAGGEPGYEGGRVTGAVGARVVYANDGGIPTPLPEVPYITHAPQATNYFLNSHAPVTQTISGRSGTHIMWLEGAGNVVLSGGLTGTVTQGNPVSGDPGGSDVICTVSGSIDFVMFEEGNSATYPIPTTGAPVTRDSCELYFDTANHDDTEGSYYLEIEY